MTTLPEAAVTDESAAAFDPTKLRDRLPPLTLAGAPQPQEATDATVISAQTAAYLALYGIDFARELPGISHHFGMVTSGDYRIATHFWRPRDAVGSAVVVHGYYDHVGLYGHLIRHLLSQGLAVMAFDLPGHGLSTGEPATIDAFDRYVDAFEDCMATLEHDLPQPWHLLGQSTGGAVIMEWLLAKGVTRDTVPFASIVLLAPLVRPYRWPLTRMAYSLLRPFVKERPRAFRGNTDNPEFLAFLRDHDPLQAQILPVAWVTAMVAWRRRFERRQATDISPLVIQGQADRTVDWRYNLKVIHRLFRPHVFFIPEAQHHLVNEREDIRAQMFQAIDGELGVGGKAGARSV